MDDEFNDESVEQLANVLGARPHPHQDVSMETVEDILREIPNHDTDHDEEIFDFRLNHPNVLDLKISALDGDQEHLQAKGDLLDLCQDVIDHSRFHQEDPEEYEEEELDEDEDDDQY